MMLKSFLFVFFNLIFAIAVKAEDGSGFCANPITESANIVDIPFIHANYKQGWNIQFGNPRIRTRYAQLLQGTETPDDTENPDEICLRESFDFLDGHHIIGTVSGHGGLTAKWNCSDENHVYRCTYFSSKNGFQSASTLYMVYFDGNKKHNSAALALCYPDDIVAWFVVSITKTLSDEETKIILDRLKTIGLDPSVRIPLQSKNCP